MTVKSLKVLIERLEEENKLLKEKIEKLEEQVKLLNSLNYITEKYHK